MVQELEEKNHINDEMFFTNGIKRFIKDYEKNTRDMSIKESLYIKRYYESKLNTIRYIKSKRNEFKEKITSIENTIRLLSNTFNELELERDLRLKKINGSNYINNIDREKFEDIIEAISESKRIINSEMIKLEDLKKQFNRFNKSSLEEENLIYIFLTYIKREFNKEKRKIVKALNSNNLEDEELILTYEYLTLITKKILCIEGELLGG